MRREEEHNIQVACVNWFRYQFPKHVIFGVPNGGQRNAIVAAKLKAEGALSGVADLIILAPNKVLFIEMKTKKGKQQQSQIDFQANCERLGHQYFVCKCFEEFRSVVTKNLSM